MMNKTTKADKFRDVFQNSLKITSRSLSVKTLLSERNLKRIDYSPYYQRNYVWDKAKQTFFIESVILGTEVPPLIFFKTGTVIEVIDGRQRFETLKKFKENDLSLSSKGLKELEYLSKQSFNKMSPLYRNTFLESNIRVFEFEVINHPNLSDDIIDKVKKEIFRRYNTGITPLSRDELDNAKYDTDNFSDLFKAKLKDDKKFYTEFNQCFFPKAKIDNGDTAAGIISQNVDMIRKFRILHQFPIATYAGSRDRTSIIDILYDFSNTTNDGNIKVEYEELLELINQTLAIYKKISNVKITHNKFIFETILWALSILSENEVSYKINSDELAIFYSENINAFSEENSHYYGNIISRYETTAQFFNSFTKVDFSKFIRSSQFKDDIKNKRQSEEDSVKSIYELSNLRLHKPNPTSIDINEIRDDLKSTNYLLRPSYQRQEKISHLKASSIIESILLGINLPPIFIYKRINGVKEVVDGQQRLLSIIGFLGDQYHNENGKLTYSKNNNFKLKGLRVINSLEGSRFSDLEEHYKDKILDFVIDMIVIEELKNDTFDPIDLFIRLNYKPYPIKPNSFEMWNSIVDSEIVQKIKKICKSKKNDWFFLREIKEGKPDRMLNEELLIALSYMTFKKDKEEVIGFFPRQDTITCRLKDKKGFSDFLFDLDNTAVEKRDFVNSITATEKHIDLLSLLFEGDINKEIFNTYLNIKENKYFRRSLQDFYIIWLVLIHIDPNKIIGNESNILSDIKNLLSARINFNNEVIDDNYVNNFRNQLESAQNKYK